MLIKSLCRLVFIREINHLSIDFVKHLSSSEFILLCMCDVNKMLKARCFSYVSTDNWNSKNRIHNFFNIAKSMKNVIFFDLSINIKWVSDILNTRWIAGVPNPFLAVISDFWKSIRVARIFLAILKLQSLSMLPSKKYTCRAANDQQHILLLYTIFEFRSCVCNLLITFLSSGGHASAPVTLVTALIHLRRSVQSYW